MTSKNEFLTLNDGTKISVPADTSLMTNFVLKEQGDWFEDEIHFVRKLVSPDMNALDIGANYGLYSTAIAKNLTGKGRLWCFEPTPDTTAALRQTIAENSFSERVTLIESGLSNRSGTATFYTSENSELNSLTQNDSVPSTEHTIKLMTLDEAASDLEWPKIDFIKLDAEGEEINILEGGKTFFENNSPLVMYELMHGKSVNSALIEKFKEIGLESYYLIPALNVLVPINAPLPPDSYRLNLFACKEETALQLANDGYLVADLESLNTSTDSSFSQVFGQKEFYKALNLESKTVDDSDYNNAISAYAQAMNTDLETNERLQNLLYAFSIVQSELKKGESDICRLSSYARICFDLGLRQTGNQICNYISTSYFKTGRPFNINYQFLPASSLFDHQIKKSGPDNAWLVASVIDAVVRKHAYSSFFSKQAMLTPINNLIELDYCASDLLKRKSLIESV